MLKWKYTEDSKCVFCRNCIESEDNLYFECGFTKRLWKEVMRKCMWGACDMDWGLEKLKGKGLRAVICKLVLGASVYHIWLQRNCRNFREQALSEESITKAILWLCKK